MRFEEPKPDYFDQHRKDHTARPVLLPAAFVGSFALWALIIALASRIG